MMSGIFSAGKSRLNERSNQGHFDLDGSLPKWVKNDWLCFGDSQTQSGYRLSGEYHDEFLAPVSVCVRERGLTRDNKTTFL